MWNMNMSMISEENMNINMISADKNNYLSYQKEIKHSAQLLAV